MVPYNRLSWDTPVRICRLATLGRRRWWNGIRSGLRTIRLLSVARLERLSLCRRPARLCGRVTYRLRRRTWLMLWRLRKNLLLSRSLLVARSRTWYLLTRRESSGHTPMRTSRPMALVTIAVSSKFWSRLLELWWKLRNVPSILTLSVKLRRVVPRTFYCRRPLKVSVLLISRRMVKVITRRPTYLSAMNTCSCFLKTLTPCSIVCLT